MKEGAKNTDTRVSDVRTTNSNHDADCVGCGEIAKAFESLAQSANSQFVGDDGSLCSLIRKHAGDECSLDFIEQHAHIIPSAIQEKKFLFCGSCHYSGGKPCYRLIEMNNEGKMEWRFWLGEDDERT